LRLHGREGNAESEYADGAEEKHLKLSKARIGARTKLEV
jgi:hypothetical protein